jgi:hypothetical protein
VETSKAGEIVNYLTEHYRAETEIEPSVLTSRPARGAHIVKSD